jgi:hypothetical protein
MAQIQEERRRNEVMKRKLALVEEELHASGSGEDDSVVETLQRAKQVQKTISDYEALLCDLFETPLRSAADFAVGPNGRRLRFDQDRVAHQLRHLMTRMMELPPVYHCQNIPTKRAIVQGLICSIEGVFSLTNQLHELHRQQAVSKTPRRIGIDIRRSVLDLNALEQAVNRFSFH